MKKYFPHISAFILTFIIIFTVGGFLFPKTVQAQTLGTCSNIPGQTLSYPNISQTACEKEYPDGLGGKWTAGLAPSTPSSTTGTCVNGFLPNGSRCTATSGAPLGSECGITNLTQCFTDAILLIPGWAAIGILKLATLLTYLSGAILNFVIKYTVVEMKAHLGEASVVNNAWGVIRDVANMGFIFILLYAAIQTILGIGEDTKKLIVRIIVIAILINFSLFFTKIVIDVSNVLAITFYDAIAPGALSATATTKGGLSDSLMQPLGLQSIFNTKLSGLEGGRLFTIGVMGTILALIVAFVFFAVAIMFVIRFVVLIFVLILSPIAFMAFVLPALKKQGNQWWDALSGQAFFAPIYFMLTWIVIVTSRGLLTGGGDMATALSGQMSADGSTVLPPTNIGILVNFIIVIVFLIASLLIAKTWANKAGPAVTGLTKWAMGAAGEATLGVAGRLGRGTIGRVGAAVGDSEGLKERAAKGGAGGMAARLALATGRKTAGASFDVRGGALGGTLQAGQAQKGGFAEFRKKQAEAAEKTAKALGPSEVALDQAEQKVKKYAEGTPERRAAQEKLDQLKGLSKKEVPGRIREELAIDPIIKRKEQAERDLKNKQKEIADTILPELRAKKEQELEAIKKVLEAATNAAKIRTTEIENKYKEGIKGVTIERKEAYAEVMEKSIWAQARGYNKAAAAQIRRGKSKEKKLAEAYKDVAKDLEPETEASETPLETSTPPTGGTSPTP